MPKKFEVEAVGSFVLEQSNFESGKKDTEWYVNKSAADGKEIVPGMSGSAVLKNGGLVGVIKDIRGLEVGVKFGEDGKAIAVTSQLVGVEKPSSIVELLEGYCKN